ncbi:MAG: trigger factor [Candidatus Acidoferrales bacterium]
MATEINSCVRELEVEVPAEAVARETTRVTKEFARLARLPGFRPGKAPAELVQRRFWEDIKGEVLHALVPSSLENALREKNLSPVGDPSVADLRFEPEKPLRFKATFEVLPEIQLNEYKGLEVEPGRVELTEEDVERELEALRQRAATSEPVEGRPAEDGDTVVTSLVGMVTKPREKRDPLVLEDVRVQVGEEGTLAAFSEGLRGAGVGEERQFTVPYPENYPEASLAGRTVAFTARVKGIERKKLPELNDEFARKIGDHKSLQELKTKLREHLEQARAQREKEVTRQRLLEALLAQHEFPVPETLVERQLDAHLDRDVRALLSQGVDPRRVDIDWARVRRDQHARALRDVRIGLLLHRIAEAENLHPSQEEIDREVERLARESRQSPDALRARLTKEDGLSRMTAAIRSEKVAEFLLSHARLTAASRG